MAAKVGGWLMLIGFPGLLQTAAAGVELPAITPEVYQYAPLRVFGTNLYDFSAVIQNVLAGHPDPRYCIRGHVVQVNLAGVPGSMIVRRASGMPGYVLRGGTNDLSAELLVGLAAVSLARSSNGSISLIQYANLPPAARTNFEWFQPTEAVLIANLPQEFLRTGKNVQFFALPLGRYQPKSAEFGPEGILYFDYGQSFTGDFRSYSSVLRVTTDGIVPFKLLGHRAQNDPAVQKLVQWQNEQATNGAAHAQYSLAKRYLSGDGVPQDDKLGEYWLEKAAEQKYPDALRLMESRGGARPAGAP